MVFSSLSFLFFFLPTTLAVYYVSPRNIRNAVLFLCSLLFYAWGEPIYVGLMIFSTLVDYVHGIAVHKYRGTPRAKAALISSIIINISLLCLFKYSDFMVDNINAFFSCNIAQPNLPLPIGISFYTFQTMSYTIDVYRGNAGVQRNILSFGAYVALFPQLIAGPIVRYSTIADQLDYRRESEAQFAEGARRFVCGLGKKVLLANNIGMVWSQMSVLDADEISVLGAWLGILAFSFQIYFDFSGYSDMAIGLGKMLGFDFPENFDYPYISRSITEFWRRWHISLGTWFREYVYIPLGGNRNGIGIQLRNIAVVWLLTGIWHGASWNFAAWGLYYCILLILEKLFLSRYLEQIPAILTHLYTLLCVAIGWVIFAFDSLAQGMRYLGWMLGGSGIPLLNNKALFALRSNAIILVVLFVASTPLPRKLYKFISATPCNNSLLAECVATVMLASLLLLSVAYLVDSTYNPFLYFRF